MEGGLTGDLLAGLLLATIFTLGGLEVDGPASSFTTAGLAGDFFAGCSTSTSCDFSGYSTVVSKDLGPVKLC